MAARWLLGIQTQRRIYLLSMWLKTPGTKYVYMPHLLKKNSSTKVDHYFMHY